MQTTIEFLDALKARHSLASDYKAAKFLGVTVSGVSLWRRGKATFDDATAIKVGKLLDLDAGYVLACVHAERAKRTEERQARERIARIFAAGITFVIIGLGAVAPGAPPAQAAEAPRIDCEFC